MAHSSSNHVVNHILGPLRRKKRATTTATTSTASEEVPLDQHQHQHQHQHQPLGLAASAEAAAEATTSLTCLTSKRPRRRDFDYYIRRWRQEGKRRTQLQCSSTSTSRSIHPSSMQLQMQMQSQLQSQLQSPLTTLSLPLSLLVIPPLTLLFMTWRQQLDETKESETQRVQRQLVRLQQQHHALQAKYGKIKNRFGQYVQTYPFRKENNQHHDQRQPPSKNVAAEAASSTQAAAGAATPRRTNSPAYAPTLAPTDPLEHLQVQAQLSKDNDTDNNTSLSSRPSNNSNSIDNANKEESLHPDKHPNPPMMNQVQLQLERRQASDDQSPPSVHVEQHQHPGMMVLDEIIIPARNVLPFPTRTATATATATAVSATKGLSTTTTNEDSTCSPEHNPGTPTILLPASSYNQPETAQSPNLLGTERPMTVLDPINENVNILTDPVSSVSSNNYVNYDKQQQQQQQQQQPRPTLFQFSQRLSRDSNPNLNANLNDNDTQRSENLLGTEPNARILPNLVLSSSSNPMPIRSILQTSRNVHVRPPLTTLPASAIHIHSHSHPKQQQPHQYHNKGKSKSKTALVATSTTTSRDQNDDNDSQTVIPPPNNNNSSNSSHKRHQVKPAPASSRAPPLPPPPQVQVHQPHDDSQTILPPPVSSTSSHKYTDKQQHANVRLAPPSSTSRQRQIKNATPTVLFPPPPPNSNSSNDKRPRSLDSSHAARKSRRVTASPHRLAQNQSFQNTCTTSNNQETYPEHSSPITDRAEQDTKRAATTSTSSSKNQVTPRQQVVQWDDSPPTRASSHGVHTWDINNHNKRRDTKAPVPQQGWISNRASRNFIQELAVVPDASANVDAHDATFAGTVTAKPTSAQVSSCSSKKMQEDTLVASSSSFRYQEVVRGREARQALPSHDCPDCGKFLDAVMEGNGANVFERHELMCQSRHRSRHTPPSTPEDFWELSFQDEIKARKQKMEQAPGSPGY
jgi:hypothetical protein